MSEIINLFEKMTVWQIATGVLFAAELIIISLFIFELVRKRKKNRSVLFLGITFLVNFALYLIPYIYGIIADDKSEKGWWLEVLTCMSNSIKAFVGEWENSSVKDFASKVPFFTVVYTVGTFLAPIATVNAAAQMFSLKFFHSIRRRLMLRKKNCDIVLGTGENALRYAKDGAAILIPEPDTDNDTVIRLIEQGYIVLPKNFSKKLLASRILRKRRNYNIVCPGKTEENLERIHTFIEYRKSEKDVKNIRLFVEIEEEKVETIRKEVIDKSCCKDYITTFCSNELLARRFTQDHPVTEYIPDDFISEDASIKPEAAINVLYLGFGSLNREMYRQSVLNNQLAEYKDGEYQLHPVNYHLFDNGIDKKEWFIDGLKDALEKMAEEKDSYYPLPPLPYNTAVYDGKPYDEEMLEKAAKIMRQDKSYNYVIVDVGDTYKNIETGTRLRSMLSEFFNYHIYIRSESAYIENDAQITYLGDIDDIFSHSVIVNDELSALARKINEMYTLNKELKGGAKENTKLINMVKAKSEKKWNEMEQFLRHSNLYAALNIRLKLQLLGLDYKSSGEIGEDEVVVTSLEGYYTFKAKDHKYEDYFVRSKRNAILAQEKYRWNSFYLLQKILPLPKADVSVIISPKGKPESCTRKYSKQGDIVKHACLTTFYGLDELTRDLQAMRTRATNTPCSIDEYDYYQYDDQIMQDVTELMERLGYIIIEKK